MSGYADLATSLASSASAAAGQNSGTTFNFNSAGARGDVYSGEVGSSAAASASASLGGDAASAIGDALKSHPILLIGGAVLLVGALGYIAWKLHKG